jgi:hypothetical protein
MNDRSDFESVSAVASRYGSGESEVLWHDRPTAWDSLCAACAWPWPMSLPATGFMIFWTRMMQNGSVLDKEPVPWWAIAFGLLMSASFAIWSLGPLIALRKARRTIFALTKSSLYIVEESVRGTFASSRHLLSDLRHVRRQEKIDGRGTLELTFGQGTDIAIVQLAGVLDVYGLEALIASLQETAGTNETVKAVKHV